MRISQFVTPHCIEIRSLQKSAHIREHHQYHQPRSEFIYILCVFLAIISSPTRLLTTKIIIPQILNLFNSVLFFFVVCVLFLWDCLWILIIKKNRDFWLKINLYVDVMEYIMKWMAYFWWNFSSNLIDVWEIK